MQRFKANRIAWAVGCVLLLAACGSSDAPADLDGEAASEADAPLTEFEELGWPREIEAEEGRILVYQPQLESFAGNDLKGRAAVSVQGVGKDEPVFGAVWLDARVETDRDERIVQVQDIEVSDVRFPGATPAQKVGLVSIIERAIPAWDATLSLDRLLTSLELAERERVAAEDLAMDPPRILFFDEPAVLVTIDGEPRLGPVENYDLMRVVNTPFPIVLNPNDQRYYLFAGDVWFKSAKIEGPWELSNDTPKEVAALFQVDWEGEPPEPMEVVPRLVVATEPTELIVSEGEPEWSEAVGTQLLFMANSESDVLLEVASQTYFVLLSGRWYSAESLDGPWSYVASDALPASFAEIPPDSENAHLLVHVAGTDEAREAVLDAQIPQTAAVSRDATIEVAYDGEPRFEDIEETDLQYAVNTADPVIAAEGRFYCVRDGVWYVADSPEGPWVVATTVPESIYFIPASNPVHYVKYVYAYDTTPEVVYVGYTPGYTGCYVYGTTVVYGTGYYYRPWYGTYYYARPATWGFHVRYNPWTGNWAYGVSYSSGGWRFTVGYSSGWYGGRACYGCGGWWGPARYSYWRGHRYGYRHGYHKGYRHGYRRGVREGYRRGGEYGGGPVRIQNRNGNLSSRTAAANVYGNNPAARASTRRSIRDRGGPARATTQPAKTPRVAQNLRNDVYTDRNGNVFRRGDDGQWQQRQGRDWKPATGASGGDRSRPATSDARPRRDVATPRQESRPSPSTDARPRRNVATPRQESRPTPSTRERPSTRPGTGQQSRPPSSTRPSQRPSTTRPSSPGSSRSNLERHHQARQRGSQRTQSYGSRPSPSRSGGGRRGGRR
jgi:hypothetical protein